MDKKIKNLRSQLLKLCFAVLIFLFCVTSSQSFAASFATDLHSTSALGNSHAGAAIGAHDASDMFANPAILSNLDKNQLIASFAYLNLNIDPDNASGSGGNAEVHDAGVDGVIPALYLALPINDRLIFGTAITVPYGLATRYDENWAGNEYATESEIMTVNFNPALSYKISDEIAIAAGVQVQYIESVLKRNIIATYPAKAKSDDVGYGYTLGTTYKVNDKIELGLGYRSKIDHKLKGDIDVSTGTSAEFYSKLTTPESVTFGLGYKISDRSELLYDFLWSRWSRINSLDMIINDGSVLDSIPFNFKDSLRYSLGYNYKFSDKFLLRTGAAYEKDAVTDAYREPRIPTGDRIWASLGFGYKIATNTTIDAAYVHQFHKAVKSYNDNQSGAGSYSGTVQSKYKNSVNVLAFSIKQEF